MFDTVLRGGTVIDGTGAAGFEADVGLRDGRLDAIGDLRGAAAKEDLDVTGQAIAPGFIDVHSHSDLAAYLPRGNESVQLASVRQGVTTEIVGNCGWTPFPAAPEQRELILGHIASVFGPASRVFDSLADYRVALASQPLPTHLAPLVGHGTIRASVLGLRRIAADSGGIQGMAGALMTALDDGAFGLSSGLVYPPGMYGDGEELVALGKVLRGRGGVYTTHMRNEMEHVLDAVDEGIAVARAANVPVQLSHLKVAGRGQWGTIDAVLARVEQAKRHGLDVCGDVYPYTAASTLLRALLPPWVNEGGVAQMLERLADSEVRRRIAEEYQSGLPGWQDFVVGAGWGGIVIASAPGRPDLEGWSIRELGDATGRDPAEAALRLLLELRGEAVVVLHMMAERDVRVLVATTDMLIGSDTLPLPGKPHPRTSGTFARILGRYVRDEGVSDLPAMVRRMTSVPSERFRLGSRGCVTEGYRADVVVFDPDTITDRATYADPLLAPSGIRHVFVEGRAVILDGQDTGARPGRVLEPAR